METNFIPEPLALPPAAREAYSAQTLSITSSQNTISGKFGAGGQTEYPGSRKEGRNGRAELKALFEELELIEVEDYDEWRHDAAARPKLVLKQVARLTNVYKARE